MEEKTLRELLDLSEVGTDQLEARFKEIAKVLFQEYHIKKGTDRYDFLEIEFYYYDFKKNHKDVIAYPRDVGAGKWFFHSSGVDISFKSNCKDNDDNRKVLKSGDDNAFYFGGILIRSLLKKGSKKAITGPRKCTWDLFDCFDAFEVNDKELPFLAKNNENEIKSNPEIKKTQREIPYNFEKAQDKYLNNYDFFEEFLEAPYRFYIEHEKWKAYTSKDYASKPWGRDRYKDIPFDNTWQRKV